MLFRSQLSFFRTLTVTLFYYLCCGFQPATDIRVNVESRVVVYHGVTTFKVIRILCCLLITTSIWLGNSAEIIIVAEWKIDIDEDHFVSNVHLWPDLSPSLYLIRTITLGEVGPQSAAGGGHWLHYWYDQKRELITLETSKFTLERYQMTLFSPLCLEVCIDLISSRTRRSI